MKKKIFVAILIYYLVAIIAIGVGFAVGNSYVVYDNPYACWANTDAYWREVYSRDEFTEMFDGCIHKKEGWYNLSWRQVYSMYQRDDSLNEDFLKMIISNSHSDMDYNWSDREFVEYISDRGAKFEHDYAWIRLDGEVLFIEYGPTNVEEDYEGAIAKTIIICAVIVIIPILVLLVLFLRKLILKASSKNINNTATSEELLNYKKLLDDGIITEEEFDAKKK